MNGSLFRVVVRFLNGSDRHREENARLLDESRPLPRSAARQQFGDQCLFMNLRQIQRLQPGGESLPAQFSRRLHFCVLALL